MCAFVPAGVGEDQSGQIRSPRAVRAAKRRAGITGNVHRPQRRLYPWPAGIVLNTVQSLLARNAFCPTGEGGGVDPTCSPGITLGTNDKHTFSTSFQVGGKEFTFAARSDGTSTSEWDVAFWPGTLASGGSTAITHDPQVSPVQVLRHVQQSLHLFIKDKEPKVIIFTANKSEPSRLKLYDRVSREIQKHYGYAPTVWQDERAHGSRYYTLSKGDMPKWLVEQRAEPGTTFNAFCPTGVGGGHDNSCSSSGNSSLTEQLVLKWHHNIDAQNNLSATQKIAYKRAFTRVIGAMPPAAVERIIEHLKRVVWAEDLHRVNEEFEDVSHSKLQPGQVTNGFYAPGRGLMCVDGPTQVFGSQSPAYGSAEERNLHGTYAHELGHALDGPKDEYSSSTEWQRAYEYEIKGHPSLSPPLSEYARTHPAEGFAEFSRLLYGSDFSKGSDKQIEATMKRFPWCFKFFRSRGLLP